MDIYSNGKLRLKFNTKTEYPIYGILLVTALICIAPFISSWLNILAFGVCLFRVIKYDAKVFATDYCVLIPFSQIFRIPGGVALIIYLCLVAAIWYFFKGKVKANSTIVILFLLLIYLITRMQMDINSFVLCFGQIFVTYVLLSKQDQKSAEQAIKAFCISIVLSSFYAVLFRSTSQLIAMRGKEAVAMGGTGIMRFQGLAGDPNYYMTLVIIGLALIMKLKDSKKIDNRIFWISEICLTVFGLMTYSKTFFLVFAILIVVVIVWQFWNKKYVRGGFMAAGAGIAGSAVLFLDIPYVSVIIARLLSADDASSLTTGRTDIYIAYIEEIFESLGSFMLGKGLAANGLYMDPHNIYLEILYYIGIIGFILIVWFYLSMVRIMRKKTEGISGQNWISKYVVLLMFLTLYFTLQGLFAVVTYNELFLALISMMIVKERAVKTYITEDENNEK